MSRIRFAVAVIGTIVFALGLTLTLIFTVVAIIQYTEDGYVAWGLFIGSLLPMLIGWGIVRLCGARLPEMIDRMPSL